MPTTHTSILHSQIKEAVLIWDRIESEPIPADRWLANHFHQHRKRIGARDRRFLSETIYALFRHKSFLAVWVNEARTRLGWLSPELRRAVSDSYLMIALGAVMGDVISLDAFDQVLSRWVPAQSRASQGVVKEVHQAVITKVTPSKIKMQSEESHLALQYSFPFWLVKRWMPLWGREGLKALLESFDLRPLLMVRANTLKISREALMARFRERGYEVEETSLSGDGIIFARRVALFDSREFREGLFEVQDEGSQFVCQSIRPEPGEVVWDVCAGGGGKSLALAALMKNKGRVVATRDVPSSNAFFSSPSIFSKLACMMRQNTVPTKRIQQRRISELLYVTKAASLLSRLSLSMLMPSS